MKFSFSKETTPMAVDRAAIEESIAKLRARRASIPAMRDYKPQRKAGDSVMPASLDSIMTKFAGLFSSDTPTEDSPPSGEQPTGKEGGE